MHHDPEDRYEFKGKIGEGGRGAVYRAYDRHLNRTVAIKRLFTRPAGTDEDEDCYEAILKEGHALSAISSPHIVRVFDIATDEEGPYVVMEFLEGRTLHEIVARAPLVVQDFLTIAEQAIEALIAAHDAKLLHRDIKPGNLMLTWLPSGRIQLKLLDFGLAKFTEKPAVQTVAQRGTVLGSIYFMAPEQFERTPLDVRTDLYSLGCVLYHSLTGRYPFVGDNPAAVMAAHIQGECDDLQPLRPDLSPALARWVMRLLARDMDDRPTDAHEALREFEVAKRATAPVATQPNPSHPRLIAGPGSETTAQGARPEAGTTTHTAPTLGRTTGQIPIQTSTTVVADPRTHLVKTKRSSVPAWVFVLTGILMILIVVLGVATSMRGDGKPRGSQDPAAPASDPPSSPPPSDPGSKPPDTQDPPEQADPTPKPRWNAAAEFKNKDKDADFFLSKAEFVVAKNNPRKAEQESLFAKLDKNRDGKLTMGEFKNRN